MRILGTLVFISLSVFAQTDVITFTKDISPIIYNKCTSCHRAGESGPMNFTSYEEVAALSSMIKSSLDLIIEAIF